MIKKDRQWAIIAYLTLIGFMIAYFVPKEKSDFLRTHLRQSFGLWLVYLAFGQVVSNSDSWTYSIAYWIVFGILFLYGLVSAAKGSSKTLPLIGSYFQKIFSVF